jgi:hypothetical protein
MASIVKRILVVYLRSPVQFDESTKNYHHGQEGFATVRKEAAPKPSARIALSVDTACNGKYCLKFTAINPILPKA